MKTTVIDTCFAPGLAMAAAMLLLSLVALPVTAASQRATELQEGARVKIVLTKGKTVIGTATAITADSMSMRFPESSRSIRIGWRDAARVEVSTGVNRSKGALIYGLMGVGIGAAGGAAVGAGMADNSSGCFSMCGRGVSASLGGILGGFIGGVAGAAGGASKGWEEWKPVAH